MKKTGSNFNQKKPKHLNQAAGKSVKPVNPRQLSFFILNRYFSEKSNLKFLLNDFLEKYPLLELDRRFVYEVVKGTVRYVIRIDFLISLFSNKTIKSLDRDVLNILRQAVYQLLYMDKTPAYAAIDESVEIAKRHIGTYSSRFVNAVLRKINTETGLQDFLDSSIEETFINPKQRLSAMYSYPEWLADYWIKSYGIDRAALLFNLFNREPTVFIRVNRLKTNKIKLIKAFNESGMLQGCDFFSEPFDNIENVRSIDTGYIAGTVSPVDSSEITAGATGNICSCGSNEITAGDTKNIGTADSRKINAGIAENIGTAGNSKVAAATIGNTTLNDTAEITSGNDGSIGSYKKTGLFDDCIVLKSVQNIEKIPGYMQGHFSVQDFSSQFAVKYFLDPTKHDKMLDICGAPGGKATYMAELTDDDAEIVSVDINIKKMNLLEENIARLGIKNITFVNADATETDFLRQEKFENYFDKIFIDAPCSALGTISKNPDAKYANSLSDMERLGEIALKILSAADKYLKPGGLMILYKCTLSEIENQEPVKRFVRQNSGKYRICCPFSEYTDVPDPASDLQQGSPKDKYYHLKQANMLLLETYLKPLNEKYLFFEIMPDWFLSEAGFICILKKSV